MEFEKLNVKNFTHTEDQYFSPYYERSGSNEGEVIHSHYYETRCRIFGVNVQLNITFANPTESFENSLSQIKQNLRWLEDNRKNILSLMTAQRSANDQNKKYFNSNQTRNMNDQKFMDFLVLSEVRMFKDYSMTLKFNEFDNIPGSYFSFDISKDKTNQSMGVLGF